METIEFKVQEFKNMTLNPDDAVADVNEKGRRICQVEIHEIPRVLREYILFPDSDETVWDKTLSIMKQHPQQLFRWDRTYPADRYFDLQLGSGQWHLVGTSEFAGHSHDLITMEVYER